MANPSSQVTQQRFVKWWLFWDCYLPTAASTTQLYRAETGSSFTARDSIQQQVAPSRCIWKQKGPRHTKHISLLSRCTTQRLWGEKTGENVSKVVNLYQNELLDNILEEEQRGGKKGNSVFLDKHLQNILFTEMCLFQISCYRRVWSKVTWVCCNESFTSTPHFSSLKGLNVNIHDLHSVSATSNRLWIF